MGILSDVRGLWARPRSLVASAEAAPPVIPPQPVGITGGGNAYGRVQYEPNALLREQAGYGRAGTYQVGEWAELALTNPYVTAALDFITAPISDARIDITPLPPESGVPPALAAQQVAFLQWALTERFRLASHNEQSARGFLLSGFALYEPKAAQAWCAPLGRTAFALASLEQRLPNSLAPNAWVESDEGALTGINQTGPRGGKSVWTSVVIPADRALLYSWLRQGNNWAGVSQLRSVWYIAGRVMPLLLKLVGVTAQREGAGLPVAFMKDDSAGEMTPGQREDLMEFFANVSFHESSGVVLPRGVDVKWILSPGSNKNHILDLWNALGLVILQQLGAQQLALGTGETGSRSVGEIHDAKAMAFVRKVLAFQEGVLNGDSGEAHTGLVSRLLAWNGLMGVGGVPRVKLTPKRPEMNVAEMATAAATLKAAGLLTPRLADENVARERLGLPPITEEERDEARERAPAPVAPVTPPAAASEDDEPKSGETEMGEDEAPLKAAAPRPGKPWAPWRALRASEAKLDLTAMDRFLASRPEVFERTIKPIVAEMLFIAAPAITAAMADGSPDEVASMRLDSRRLDAALDQYLAEVRAEGGRTVRRELRDDLAEELLEERRLAAAADEDEQDDKGDEREREAVRDADEVTQAQRKQVSRRIQNRLRSELEREAIDTIRTGGDASDVVANVVAEQLESGAFRSDAAYVTTKAFNTGRDEAARILGGIASVEYSAILDNATCDACRQMDGQTAAFDSPEHDAMVPPNRECDGGDRCRCVLVMIPSDGGDE